MLMGDGPGSEWYRQLDKAPWTPPGWLFGVAWSAIMVCFAIYMARAWEAVESRQHLITVFCIQWLLNVAWNPVFFRYHLPGPAMAILTALTLVVGYIAFRYLSSLKWNTILLLPYIAWLLIACSLNGYAWLRN